MNPISQSVIPYAEEMTKATQTQTAVSFGICSQGLKKALDVEKQEKSWRVGTLLKISQAFSMTIIIHAGALFHFAGLFH